MPNHFQILKDRLFDSKKIYEGRGGYNYKLPPWDLQKLLEGFLTGRTVKYTEDELDRVRDDITNLAIDLLLVNPEQGSETRTPKVMIAVGAPGAGKTVLMQGLKQQFDEEGRKFIYLDPYDVCLQKLTSTFQADLEASDGSYESREAIYQKWRPAALGAYHLLVAHMIREKYSLLLCSKSSDPFNGEYFELYHQQKYFVTLLHITAPHDLRRSKFTSPSLIYTPSEIANAFRIAAEEVNLLATSYLKHAHHIEFFYRENEDQAPVLAYAVTLTAIEEAVGITLLHTRIFDPAAFNKIALVHDSNFDVKTNPQNKFRNIIAKRLAESIPTYDQLNF